MDEVCDDVEVEPSLQSLEGETFDKKTTSTDDEARLDTGKCGYWGSRFTRTLFDVKMFSPHARSCSRNINDAYKDHERSKKLKYDQRILDVEKATFTPLVFACTGGAGPSATKAIQQLASKLSEKRDDSYANVIAFIRTKLSFGLLRSAILCIRGSRSVRRSQVVESSIGTIVQEGRLTS